MYVIERTDQGGGYVTRPGTQHSYSARLQDAKTWPTYEAAARERCPGNERIVPIRVGVLTTERRTFTAEEHRRADDEEECEVLELAGTDPDGMTTRQALGAHYDCDPEYFDGAILRLVKAGRVERRTDGTLRLPT